MLLGSNLWQVLKAFNLVRLLENEEMEMFSMTERRKSNCKFGGTKIFEADKIEHFINPKVENEAFDECVNLVWISEILHA